MTKDKHALSWSFREDFSPAPHSKFGKFDPRPAAQTTDEFLYNHLSPQSLEPNPNITDEQFVRRLFSPLLSAHPPLRWHVNSWIPVEEQAFAVYSNIAFKRCGLHPSSLPILGWSSAHTDPCWLQSLLPGIDKAWIMKQHTTWWTCPQALYLVDSPLNITVQNSNSVLGGHFHDLHTPEEKIDLIHGTMLYENRTVMK